MGLTVIYFRIGKTVRCIVLFALITRRNTQMSYCSGRLLSNKSLKLGELYTNLNLFFLSPWGNPIKDIMKKSYFDGTLFLFNLSSFIALHSTILSFSFFIQKNWRKKSIRERERESDLRWIERSLELFSFHWVSRNCKRRGWRFAIYFLLSGYQPCLLTYLQTGKTQIVGTTEL